MRLHACTGARLGKCAVRRTHRREDRVPRVCASYPTDPCVLTISVADRAFTPSLLADLPSCVDPCGPAGEFHTFVASRRIWSRTIRVIPGGLIQGDNLVYADLLPDAAGPR